MGKHRKIGRPRFPKPKPDTTGERFLKREPILVRGLVALITALGIKFGFQVEDDIAYAIATTLFGLALVLARSKVTPVAAPVLSPGTVKVEPAQPPVQPPIV